MQSALRNPQSAAPLAAVYGRVSTDQQDNSLELQERRVHDYSAFKGLALHPDLTFSDPDTSGRTPMMERLGGRALMNRLKLGDVQHLVVAKLDRLGRNVRDALGVLEFLQKQGITLHITDFGGETISTQGHMGRLILTVLLAVSEWEVEEIRDRTLKVARAKFDRNELVGNIPYGYDCVYTFADGHEETHTKVLSAENLAGREVKSKLLVDNALEQNIIVMMYELRFGPIGTGAVGELPPRKVRSLKQVADELNNRGYRTKQGSRWSTGSVDSVLKSRHTERLLDAQTSLERRSEAQTSALTE